MRSGLRLHSVLLTRTVAMEARRRVVMVLRRLRTVRR